MLLVCCCAIVLSFWFVVLMLLYIEYVLCAFDVLCCMFLCHIPYPTTVCSDELRDRYAFGMVVVVWLLLFVCFVCVCIVH